MGIRWKLMLGMVAMILTVVASLTLVQVEAQKRVLNDALETHSSFLREQMQNRANSVSASIARHIQERIVAFDMATAEEFIQSAVKDIDELQYVILQKSGHPIIAQGKKHDVAIIKQLLSGDASANAANLMQTSHSEFTVGGHAFLETDVPIFLNKRVKWGTLRLAYTLDDLNQALSDSRAYVKKEIGNMISRATMTALGFLIFGSLVVFYLASSWTRPIRQLVSFSKRLADGDFSAKPAVRARSRDEVGMLVESLEEMADGLKRSHDQLEEYSHNLEAKVDVRTRELEEARDRAIEADKSKSEFLANMSHEIRTPINAVIGLTHLALDREEDRMQRDYLSKTLKASESLLSIINDILDFSKIEADRMELDIIDFGMEEVMHNLAGIGGIRASEKGLDFLIDCPTCMPQLKGDPYRLGQVLLNLVNNAIKFTESGQVMVSVQMLEVESDNYRLRFEVRDTGIGMNAEQQSRLFQAFSQADSSITRRFGGTGLGLAICKQLVSMMGGMIGLQSKEKEGSVFYFEIDFEPGATFSEADSALPESMRDLHVLIVDDNEDSKTIIAGYLEGCGLSVSKASTITEAADRLKSESFGLMMVDWTLADCSGMASIDMIRSAAGDSAPRAVLIANYGQVVSDEQVREAGADATLFKPVTATSLLATLVGLSDEHSGAGTHALRTDSIAHLQGTRLLLVEDNPLNQVVAEGLLGKAGISLSIAHNGQQALDAVEQDTFDGVLMDMQMPVMDGLEATRRLREQFAVDELPIIAMTANAMPQDVRNCLEAGMNDHIAKPIDPSDLYAKLDRWITNSRLVTAGVTAEPEAESEVPIIPELVGIDQADGLKRVAGDARLFAQVLGKFADSQVDMAVSLREAMQESKRQLSIRLVHSLTGAAGNCGATGLHQLAAKIEAILKAGEVPENADIDRLERELKETVAAINDWRALQQGSAEETEAMTPEASQAAILRMREMLQAYDGDAVDYLNDFMRAVGLHAGSERGRLLKKYLDGYDFDAALTLVDTVIGEQ